MDSGLFEKLGQYSYSVYLVHFPVIVLGLYQPFSGTILKPGSAEQALGLVALISALAFLMYHFIEVPLRSHKGTPKWLLASGVSVLFLGPMGVAFQRFKFAEEEMTIYQAWTDRAVYRCGKINRLINPTAKSCEITAGLSMPSHRILLVGNSHADAIKTTFASIAQAKNISVYFMVENNPLMQGGVSVEGIIHEAILRGANAIVLHYSHGAINASTVQNLAALAEKKGIAVSFIMPVPTWNENVPMALWKNMKEHKPLPAMTIQDYRNNAYPIEEELSKIRNNNFRIYHVARFFCRDACRLVDGSGKPLYFDSAHLTLTGSELLRGLFRAVLEQVEDELTDRHARLHRAINAKALT